MKNLNSKINKYTIDKELVSYCGLYCGACKKYLKKECEGCKSKNKVTPKWCKVKPCNEEKKTASCAECTEYSNVKDCKKLYPLSYKLGEVIAQMSRKGGIEMIKSKGYEEFAEFMATTNLCLCMKNKYLKKALE